MLVVAAAGVITVSPVGYIIANYEMDHTSPCNTEMGMAICDYK